MFLSHCRSRAGNTLRHKVQTICEKHFKLIIDSSDVGISAVLVQEASDGLHVDEPVSYFSRKFLKYQRNYSVGEKETLGLVLVSDHFDFYLGSMPFKIKVDTGHNPLTFLKQ